MDRQTIRRPSARRGRHGHGEPLLPMLTPFMVAANRNANALSQLVFDARTTALQLVCLCEPGTPAHKIAMALSAAADRAEKSAQ